MKHSFFFRLLFIILSIPFTVSAQREVLSSNVFTYQYLTTKEGLSNQRVFSILEDGKGLIWISTKSGVDCFNGRNVQNYSLFEEDILVDGAGRTIYLLKDSKEGLWAYTDMGKVFKYDYLSDAFLPEWDAAQLIGHNIYLNSLHVDQDGCFWLGLTDGLFFYDPSAGIRTLMEECCINSLSLCNEKVYLATTDGVFEYNRQEKVAEPLLSGVNAQSVFYDEATSLLWIGTFNSGVKILDTHTEQFRQQSSLDNLPQLPYRSIILYNDDLLLLGIDGAGVYMASRDANSCGLFLNANMEEEGKLKGNGVYAIYKDRSDNIWVGSYTGGVTYANPKKYFFEHIRHEYKNPQSLTDNHVNAILEDRDGDLWYATNQGISIHFTQSNTWKHFLRECVFLTLCDDGNGHVWTGGYGTGVYYLSKHIGVQKHLTAENSDLLTTDYVYSIQKDPEGDIWFGGMYGKLSRYTPVRKSLPEKVTTYDITLINSITAVNKDTMAIATANGFYLLNKNTGFFRHYFAHPSGADTQSNSFIYSMYFPTPSDVWFGTDGGGLNHFDLLTEKAVTYSTANGLPSNYIYSIFPDEHGHLWISTDKGLAHISLSPSFQVSNIGFLDGMANEFNFNAFTRLRSGDFIYGSTDGAVRFHPDHFASHLYTSSLQFTSFEVPQKSRKRAQEKQRQLNLLLREGTPIHLRYDENSFLVSYISVSYQFQQDIQYSYLLEGFEQNWSIPTNELSVRYTNIPPGDYLFRVKSMSENGKYQLDEQSVQVHIALPFWDTPLAWFIYFALILGLTYFIWLFFSNKIERKYFSEKIQFFINTAHDIRTPVTLIMAPLNDLSKENGLSEEGERFLHIARRNTEKLYNLVTQLLDFQKIDTTHLTLQVAPYELKSYLEEKVIWFQPFCEGKQIRLQLLLPDVPLILWMDKDKADKIFDNLLSNAVKYTPVGGEVTVRVRQTESKIHIEIKDNGIGIPRNAQRYIFSNFYRAENAVNSKETGSGIGLLLTRRLMKLHKGDISFVSNEGEGSTFFLTFRQGNRHLSRYVVSEVTFNTSVSGLDAVEKAVDTLSLQEMEENSAETDDGAKDRIMIVEDNDELRFYLRKTFERAYCVIDKPDAASCLEYLTEKTVDLVISDVMMPGMQGDELCRRIKESLATSHIPVILLTAKTEKEAVLEGLESGADDYLTKPFDAEILKTKIKGVLRNRKIMRQYFQDRSLKLSSTQEEEQEAEDEKLDLLSSIDKDFLEQCTQFVLKNLENPEFNINQLCRELGMSRTIFYEKLKALTGQAPNIFVKFIRMNEAAKLIKQQVPIQEVAYMTGFTDAKYFSTVFKKHFGVSPSKFLG